MLNNNKLVSYTVLITNAFGGRLSTHTFNPSILTPQNMWRILRLRKKNEEKKGNQVKFSKSNKENFKSFGDFFLPEQFGKSIRVYTRSQIVDLLRN
jgi:hypothetical protein